MTDQDNLQFDRAEPAAGVASLTCNACTKPITSGYYEINGQVICATCRQGVEEQWNRGGAAGRFGAALGLGLLATIACAIVWYIVLKLTDSQWGILAIAVGLAVGAAVRKGSNGRGGWRYQALAMFLVYTAIVSSYVPFILEGIRDRSANVAQQDSTAAATLMADSTPSAVTAAEPLSPLGFVIGVLILIGVLYATPFLVGLENLVGILIIGFALYQAWSMNRRTELRITGPYQIAAAAAAS